MKRTCYGCKALGTSSQYSCGLGYKTEKVYKDYSTVIDVKPLEDCPKPKTNNEYVQLYFK